MEVVARNGTGLTNPEFFNWEMNAQQEIAAREPDAVVMVMGGNDGFNVIVDGQLLRPARPRVGDRVRAPDGGGDARARLATASGRSTGCRRRPRATRSSTRIFAPRTGRSSTPRAAVPGARYVDIFNTIDGGKYSDELRIDGDRVLSRQADGVHFTRDGAVVPARLILRAMAKDYRGAARHVSR